MTMNLNYFGNDAYMMLFPCNWPVVTCRTRGVSNVNGVRSADRKSMMLKPRWGKRLPLKTRRDATQREILQRGLSNAMHWYFRLQCNYFFIKRRPNFVLLLSSFCMCVCGNFDIVCLWLVRRHFSQVAKKSPTNQNARSFLRIIFIWKFILE